MPKKKARKATDSPREKLKHQARQFGKEAEALGKKLGKKGEEFGKRFEKHGESFGKKVEKHGDECCGRDYRPFSAAGLILSIIVGILGLAISIWALDILAQRTGSAVLYELHDFLFFNIGAFILIFLFSSALTHFSRYCRTGRVLLSPLSSAFGITVFFWIASSIMLIDGGITTSPVIYAVAQYMKSNLMGIFLFFLMLGYFFLLIQLIVRELITKPYHRITEMEQRHISNSRVKRLYRSGNDRIIGGVCGGIAEYFGVDPVPIRLIWVILALAGGSGVLLYMIAWLIIPRNPNHRW